MAYSYGMCRYSLYSYGLCSHSLYSYCLYRYGLCSQGIWCYGLYSYGIYSHGIYSLGLYSYCPYSSGRHPVSGAAARRRRCDNYCRHLGIADGMSIARVWASEAVILSTGTPIPAHFHAVGDAEIEHHKAAQNPVLAQPHGSNRRPRKRLLPSAGRILLNMNDPGNFKPRHHAV